MLVLREGDTPSDYFSRTRDFIVGVTSENYADTTYHTWVMEHSMGQPVPGVDRRWWVRTGPPNPEPWVKEAS